MVTTQTADSVLKSYYLNVVSDMLDNHANPFLAMIKKTTADVWGRDVRKIVRYGINGGIGAGTEEGDLPTPGGANYVQFVTPLKNLYGTIEISDKAIRASANSEGAFVNLLNDEMESLVKASSFNLGRMLFGNGNGYVAYIERCDGGGTLIVDMAEGLMEGMIVDIYDKNNALLASGRKIVKIDRMSNRVDVSGEKLEENKTTYGHIAIQGSKGLELTGLGAIFSEDDIYGLKRLDNLWMRPYFDEGHGTLSELDIIDAIDFIEKTSGSKINVILCSYEVRKIIYMLLSAKGSVNSVELQGGFKTIAINGVPVIADRFCPPDHMYLLNSDDFALHQLCDWQWLEGEDGKVLKQVAGKPVYTATLVKYAELMCYRPWAQGVISGITGPEF